MCTFPMFIYYNIWANPVGLLEINEITVFASVKLGSDN